MSHASDMLAKIEAELIRRADAGFVESYSTSGGTSFNGLSVEQLEDLRRRYQAEVAAESSKGGIFSVAKFL